eukprot:TRINITY_DN2921_c1_g1_i4.p1 TRINITY_DN2921_c1_g1~~TRINITY_DN2921_c1_g1_i4.p1  ORF type:complete len:719 (+),score=205.13 TRINITY_DN2921_c1_g1_i4:672-2828(+)
MNVAYHTRSLGTWKPGDLNPPAGFERAAPPFVVSRWREAMLWFASADRHIYVYGSFDAVLAPPPPPHPWSGYRAIFKITQFLYSTWDEPLREYALRAEPGTHVVVYDSVKNVVFASTQGGDRVSQDCSRSDIFLGMSKSPCAFRLANLTATLRDGALSMLGEPRGKLLTKELDGVDHFVRKEHVFNDVEIVWMRPRSSVQGDVNDALVLLIAFTATVLAFDLVIAFAEVTLVALPLRVLEKAIAHAGAMATEEAYEVLETYGTRVLMVGEIRSLLAGMTLTTAKLQAFRAYLPSAILDQLQEGAGDSQDPQVPPPGAGDGDEPEVTIVFTDIRASTSLWEAAPSAMKKAIRIHNTVLRRCIATHQGYEVKTIGDAFMVAFGDPVRGMEFGLDVQRMLFAADWPEEILELGICKRSTLWGGLTVRIGVNHGPVTVEVNQLSARADYFGHTVNVAARLEAACKPGGVTVPEAVWGQVASKVEDASPGRAEAAKMKGVSEPVMILGVLPGDLSGRRQNPLVEPTVSGKRSNGTASVVSVSSKAPQSVAVAMQMKRTDGTIGMLSMRSGVDNSQSLDINMGLGVILPILDQSRGLLVTLIGKHLLVGWNISRQTRAHVANSLRFAQRVLQLWESHVTFVLATGPVHHGDVGTSNQRFVTAAGDTVEHCLTVWRLARDQGVPFLFTVSNQEETVTHLGRLEMLCPSKINAPDGLSLYEYVNDE